MDRKYLQRWTTFVLSPRILQHIRQQYLLQPKLWSYLNMQQFITLKFVHCKPKKKTVKMSYILLNGRETMAPTAMAKR